MSRYLSRRLAHRSIPLMLALACTVVPTTLLSSPPEPDSVNVADLRSSVDLRPIFDRLDLPPRAQGDRNTCSVFAIVGAMEYAVALKQQKGIRLSIEYLNWASNQEVGQWKDGSFFSDLWTGFEKHGACLESDMPYDATRYNAAERPSREARENAQQTRLHGLRMHWIKEWDPKMGLTDTQFAAVKAMLDRNWPVCGGLLWPKKATWTGSTLDMPPRTDVRDGHSVLLVGYRDDTDRPGEGVFIIRDSGKRRLGNELSYDYVRAYMNDAVWIDYQGAPKSAK